MTDFLKKMKILKIGKSSKFVVECDRISKTSQNFQKLGFFSKKEGFSIEKLIVFKYSECCKFPAECDWSNKVSQNVQSLLFLKKKHGFFKNKIRNVWKLPEEADLK